jgi:hypothetical protein
MPKNYRKPTSQQDEFAGKYWQKRIKENELFSKWLEARGVRYDE